MRLGSTACVCALLLLCTSRASALDDVRVHLELGGAHALGDPQQSEFGFGAQGALALELPIAKPIGIQAEVLATVLTAGSAPADPTIAPKSTGVGLGAMLGVRIRPFVHHPGGLWLDVNGGVAATGDVARPSFDAHVGWDFRVGSGRFDLGPYAGYTHIFELGMGLQPQDAHILAVGLSLGLGATAVRGDKDGDGVFDDEDACPDVPGRRTNDPKTNGCPRTDRDHDGVYDDEDACPDLPGRHTSDPKTNGCPRTDRDGDTVFDDEDACPDIKGVRTDDPLTNGCPPPDRDNDGIPDASDACPDLPGIATNDPKTNGCPLSTGPAHIEGDQIVVEDIIHFDTDDSRVHHASWPLVKKVADLIRANPDILEVHILGHADKTGGEEHNRLLSKARAESVRRLLVFFGVEEQRLTTEAFGASKPRAQSLSENRRVEFIITKTRPAGGKP
jgi:outer membrane protein OmpA-like peptidoglycan-associated protein